MLLISRTYFIHDIKFDLNRTHRRFLFDLTKFELDHTSERTIGGSINRAGVCTNDNVLVHLFDELIFGVIFFKLLVKPSSDE